jgi:fatty acid desaturase
MHRRARQEDFMNLAKYIKYLRTAIWTAGLIGLLLILAAMI